MQLLWTLIRRPDRRLAQLSLERILRHRNKRGLNSFDLVRLLGDEQLQSLFARFLSGHGWTDAFVGRPHMAPWTPYYAPAPVAIVDPPLYRYGWNPLRSSRSLDSICSSTDVRPEELTVNGANPATMNPIDFPSINAGSTKNIMTTNLNAMQSLSSSSEELRRILHSHYENGATTAASALPEMTRDAVTDLAMDSSLRRPLTRNYGQFGWPDTYPLPIWAGPPTPAWNASDQPYQQLWAQETLSWFHGARGRKQSLDALYGPSGDRLANMLMRGEEWVAARDQKQASSK